MREPLAGQSIHIHATNLLDLNHILAGQLLEQLSDTFLADGDVFSNLRAENRVVRMQENLEENSVLTDLGGTTPRH